MAGADAAPSVETRLARAFKALRKGGTCSAFLCELNALAVVAPASIRPLISDSAGRVESLVSLEGIDSDDEGETEAPPQLLERIKTMMSDLVVAIGAAMARARGGAGAANAAAPAGGRARGAKVCKSGARLPE